MLSRDDDLETAQFSNAELQAQMKQLQASAEEAQHAAAESEEVRARAVAALDGVKAEAVKAAVNAERHQEVSAEVVDWSSLKSWLEEHNSGNFVMQHHF